MKTVEYYLELNYRTSVYRDNEGDFITEVDDLPGCVAHGETPDEAFKNLEEAKRAWVESRLAAGLEIPEPRQIEDYSGKVLLRMPRSLHRRLAEQSSAEEVSLNQYIVSLLSYASAGNRAFSPAAQPAQFADQIYQTALSVLKPRLSQYFVGTNPSSSVSNRNQQQLASWFHPERPVRCLADSKAISEFIEEHKRIFLSEESRKWGFGLAEEESQESGGPQIPNL